MKYRYRLWCDDCQGDPQGCFDGGADLSEESYDTYTLADLAGYKATSGCAPWDYRVTDEVGNEVKMNE